MGMKKVRVEEAEGMVLAHDISKIIPGVYKGPAFKKGHRIGPEDIPHLKTIGKDHIFLLELAAGQVHEDEAVRRLAAATAGKNILPGEPSEGKILFKAEVDGLLHVDRDAVCAVNSVEHAVLSTRHDNTLVKAGETVAAVKVVPLVVDESTVVQVEEIGVRSPGMVAVRRMRNLRIGVVITGSEVFYGRIQDAYAPVIAAKIEQYGCTALGTEFRPDEPGRIAEAILGYVAAGADMVIAAGGMSVDPDDVTPEAIRSTGADVVTYGSPVLPGAMFMLAYLGGTTLIGMPACGMFSRTTVLDLVLPRLAAGQRLSRADIAAMGHGGLCLGCQTCVYPHCPFGK